MVSWNFIAEKRLYKLPFSLILKMKLKNTERLIPLQSSDGARASIQSLGWVLHFLILNWLFKKKTFFLWKSMYQASSAWFQWTPLSAFCRWAPGWHGWSSRRAPWRRSGKSSRIWCTWPNAAGTWATTTPSWSSWLASGMGVGEYGLLGGFLLPAAWHWINCLGNHIYPNQTISRDYLGEITSASATIRVPQRGCRIHKSRS